MTISHRKLAATANFVAIFGVIATPAIAQEKQASPSYVDEMRRCASISNDDARLACFDAASAELVADFDSGEVRLVRTEEVEKTRRGVFGFSIPSIRLFGGRDDEGDDVQPLDKMTSTITRVWRYGDDDYRIQIEEGDAIWEMTNTPSRFREPKVGDSVELEKAAMQSYWVRVNGRLGVKGRRIQ